MTVFFCSFLTSIAENKVKVGAEGGIETVVKVINAHINNASICYAGCGVLCEMITNGKNVIYFHIRHKTSNEQQNR